MSPFIEQLGWVLIHSLWQLALLAAAAFVVQRAMQRTSAAARYAALLALLVLVVAAPLITWSVLPAPAAIPVAELPDPVPARASEPAPQLEPVAPALAPAPVTVESTPPITAVTPVPPEPIVPAKAPEPLKPSWSQWAQQSITPWLSTIVWGWSLGVLAFAIRPLWSWFTVRQLRTQGVSPVSESVQAALAETARRLGMTQAVRVLQSTIVQVPIVAGYMKPVILLPASIVTGLPASQLEAILAHELAHIRRHDYLANLIQTLVETVFFYHPAVWWLSHQIRSERENCCDDIAVAMLGNRLDYSRALLAVEELRGSPTTLAVGASGGSLLGRVRRLFHRDVEQLRLSNGSITLCGLIGIGLIALAAVASTNHDGSSELFVPGAKAEIDGFGTLEVLGLRFVDSEWWSPDGSNLSASVDLGDPIRHLFNDDPMNGRQIGIVARFSGVDSPRQSRVRLDTIRTGDSGSWWSQGRRRVEQNQVTDIRFCSTNLSPEANSGELKVLLSFDAWSPWYTIDLKSPEASQNEGPLALLVGRTPSSLASTKCEIGLQFKSGVHEEIHFEQIALDAAGNEIPSIGKAGNHTLGLMIYSVPESQVAKLRYRFQRFTHEVRFRNISLKAGHQTEPKARVQVLHRSTRPAAFSEPVTSLASWPQLGGSAAHNPISPVTNLPSQFHLDRQENIRWSQPIGDFAFSSPVVSGGKVLIGTNNAIGRDPQFSASIDRACLQCFDERTGEFLWQYSSPKMEQGRRHDWPSIGICSTPVIEGDRVWFATNRCEIVCLDLNGHRDNEDDGEPEASAPGGPSGNARSQRADVVWKYDMFNTLGVRPLNATCVTPVIAGDLLLLNSGNDVDESYVNIPAPEAPAFLAVHKTTGQLIWSDKTPNSNILGNGCSMGAPAVAKIDGVWQAIFAGYDGWLYAFDLECIQRGETLLLWTFDLNPKESQYRLNGPRNEFSYRGLPSTPVVVGDHVFAAVGHNPERGEGLGRLWCIDATKRGDLSSDLVYNKAAPDVVIPHKRVQACEPDKGDFTRPNPNSGVEWVYTTDDLNKNGKIEFEEQMHLSNSLPAIHGGLLLTTDLSGLVHCLDVTTGELLWTHDQLATCWSGPLLADGKAWVIDEDGDLSIFALSREKQLIAEIAMNSSGYTNLAAANQTLYLATKTQLVAIGSGEFPDPDGVTAKLPGGLEIELVGVTPNSAATTEGWRPDGSPIAGAGDWPRGAMFSRDGDRFTVTTDSSSKLTPDPLARDVLFECRGATSSPSWTITRQGGWTEFQALNVESGLRRRLSLQRKDQALNTTVEMAYTDSPWGPWQRIGADGKRINSIETFAPDQQLYNDIRIERIGSSPNPNEKGNPLELVLNEPATGNDYQSGVFAIEVRLISKSQKVLPTFAAPQPMKDGRRTVTWRTAEAVPLESLQYAEFRLRPYRHFITFENVPLEKSAAGKTTVKHRSIPEPPRRTPDNRFVARLPDGMEIELLRIVRNDLPEEQNWLPNGEVPTSDIDWPNRWRVHATENGITSSSEGPGSDRVWDVAYAYRPTSSPPLVSVEFGGGSSSSATSLNQVGLRTISLAPKDPAQLNKLQLRVGNEPWGQWIQVDAEGGILNPAAINEQPNSPDTLIRIVGAGIDEENPDRSWIKWLALPNADQLYSMEVRAIDDDGNIHEARHRTHGVTMQPLHEMTYRFELSAEKLKRFEYRTRPYRHLVSFDQICTDPAKPTEVKVSVDRITYPEEVVEILPIEKSRLLVLNPDNTPWQGSLVAGHIGFIPPDTKAWNAWVGKDGRADLSALPAGKHWLISRFPWSVIPVETPFQQSLRQPLRLGTPPKKHSSSNYSGNLSVQRDEQGREFIHCDLYNNTDELWSFSELDLTLEAGWFSTESQGHSPQWLGDKLTQVPQIEIAPGQKGSLRIDWSEWAKRGVWDPMSGPQAVSKPVLPDQEPGKIWVRISGPGIGTESIAVTHPDKLLAASDEPVPQPPAADELDGPRIDLIGLTYDSVPKKETWNTNGQPLAAPEWVQQLPKLYGDDKSQPAPLYLFEVHGLRAKPSFRHRYQPAVVSGDDEVPEGRPYRMAVLYEDLKPEERNQFIVWGEHPAVRITDEPWGPWRTITKEGQFAEPMDPNTLYREGYDMVTLHGFRPLTKKPNDPELAPDAVRTGLVLKHPMDYDSLYAIEIEAVPSSAGPQLVNVFTSRPVQRFRNEAKDRWDVESEWPVDPTKIDHLRYRIRPYRHRFEFQEVAYKQYERPATSAPFKVIHTKLEHDLPKPSAAMEDLKTQASLIQDLVSSAQSVRDRAAAQLRSVFKPSAKEPWQQKVESIPKDAPRAEVFSKLGIDEKGDLDIAINSMEQYRLDDTWMARIWFTGDLQKLNTMELVEQLHRPWVDPPADFTGTWVTYYVSGVKAHEIDYRNGKYHGRHRSYHANGQLLVQQHYTDQVANGEDTGYFASGKLMYRGLYEDDKQVGPWIHYNEDGTERSRTEHPKPTRPKTSGKLLTEIRVVDDATGQPVTGGKVTVRWSFDRHALEISGKPVRNVFDFQEEFNLTEQGTFPIRIPAGMEDAKLHVQESVKHPDYVIEQSFGHWSLTPEMVADPALLKAKLFAGRPITLKRGHEVSGLVTDGLGQPVAGVRVYAAMQMPEYLNMPPHAVTDTQGRYKFRVPEHDGYQLMFVPADRDKSAARTDKPADLTTLAQVSLVAQSIPIRKQYGEHPVVKLVSGTRIVGVVRDSAGRPLPNIVVQANDDDSVYMGFPNVMSRVVTDAEGRYELPAQKLPVDVRIARYNQLGGWSEPTAIPTEVYLPEFVTERWGKLRVGDENVYEVDFAPVKTVTLQAKAYNAKGQPDADAEIELVAKVSVPGAGPDQRVPYWRRTFKPVPGEAGRYELKAPQGLIDARIDLTGEGLREPAVGTWTRAARAEEKLDDPRTRAAWPVLDRDDDSIIIGEPAAVALNPPGADARFPFLRNRHADRPGL